ncbi:unnamed protein product [Rotaria sordida]|uniref:Uncharacterized protein n=1 Tax=Rotaria sordida TaxID=392033 RepID=A0A814ER47_9BILA|nr:unnamed protein product [Rotaria sordida]CAF3912773.1 unnamed protein product [Rotaria sordida]
METDIERINEWRSRSIQEIKSYADEQIRILKLDYDNQRPIFDEKRDGYLEIAKVYHISKGKDLFNELYTACQLLEFQMGQLEYVLDQKQRPKVITVEELTKGKKQDTTKAQAIKFENNQTRSIDENVYTRESNENDITKSSAKSISSMPNGTYEELSMTSSSNINDSSIGSNNNSKTGTAGGDDINSKCPICCMIFPLTMSCQDQYQHINEHMTDDNNTSVYC